MEQFIWILEYYIIPALLSLTLLVTILLILKRIHHQYYKEYKKKITQTIHLFLAEIVLSKPDKKTLKELLLEFRTQIPFHRSWCKEMVINDMIHIKNNLKGKHLKNLTLIYRVLKLNLYSARLIKDFRSYKKCEGFYHFQLLDYKPGATLISKYTMHPNKVVRSNANMAYISLTEDDWHAVDILPIKTSILNVIKVMDVFHSQKVPIPPNIDQWILSKNKTILKLALITMTFYNYRNKSTEIINLLDNDDVFLKIDIITAIRNLFLVEAEDKLLAHLETESTQIQLEILRTLREIGSQKTIMQLNKNIIAQPNKDLKLKMVKCLDKLDSDSLDRLGSLDLDTQKMIRHIRKVRL